MFKQAFVTFIAILGLNSAATAQTDGPQSTAAQICAAPKVAGKVIDLKEVPGGNLMTVPVEIDGTPKQFLLDISADPDQVSDLTRAELHLPQVDQSTASNAMAGLNTSQQFRATFYDVKGANAAFAALMRVRVASFTIAGATVQNLELLVANDRDMGKSKPYDGILTGSIFPQYDINFDFGKRQLSFLDATSCADPNQVAYWPHAVVAVMPLTIKNGKMSVPVTIQGHQIDAVIDTGSDHTVMRRDVAERVFGLQAKAPDMVPDGDQEDGMGQQIYQHSFPQITFGGVIANNVPALIQTNSMTRRLDKTPSLASRAQFSGPSDRIPDLALGMDVLHQLHLYAAFDENKLYVTPAE